MKDGHFGNFEIYNLRQCFRYEHFVGDALEQETNAHFRAARVCMQCSRMRANVNGGKKLYAAHVSRACL